jgi:plastocyanin
MRYLPWMACAVIALVGAPALAAGGDPPSTAAIVAYDEAGGQRFQDASQASPTDHTVEITSGGTVTFSFPAGNGTSVHNVDFKAAPKPTSCVQTKPVSGQAQAPPVPSFVQPAGWEGNCTFNAPGTYAFVCGVHADMTGTVIVTAPTPTATETATATATADPTATAVPVAATAVPQPTPPPPSLAPAPKLSSAVFKRSKRTITVAGSSQAGGNVTVELAYKSGKATRKNKRSVAIKGGKFSATFKLSAADARKAQKLTVTASYAGVSPARKSVTIKK